MKRNFETIFPHFNNKIWHPKRPYILECHTLKTKNKTTQHLPQYPGFCGNFGPSTTLSICD